MRYGTAYLLCYLQMALVIKFFFMEKILVVFNATHIKSNVLEFACYVATLTHSKLTGIFLERLPGKDLPALKNMYGTAYIEAIMAADSPENIPSIPQSEQNIRLFEEACSNRGLHCSIHRNRGVPVEEIIRESRFADLLIVDAEMSIQEKPEGTPTGFIKEVLAKSECPVVIAPYTFYGIDEILFAYDGSRSSVFAIKQFTYLFPELSDKKVILLQVNEGEDVLVIQQDKISELLQMHYSTMEFRLSQGNASDELFGYLLGKKNIFVVMGAFGRTMLSDFFRPSTAALVIKTVNLPVFIAHR